MVNNKFMVEKFHYRLVNGQIIRLTIGFINIVPDSELPDRYHDVAKFMDWVGRHYYS